MEKDERRKMTFVFLMEAGCILIAALGIFFLEYMGVLKQGTDRMLCDIVLVALGIGVVGFHLRMCILKQEMEYDNAEHMKRFWLCFLSGLAVAFASAFLPTGAWPFLAVFVLLGLFGNQSTGALAGAVLLAIPVLLSGCGAEVYLLYLISGLFGIALFGRLHNGFKIGSSFFLSLSCLFVCITAGTVLVANARPDAEYFLIPAVNVVVSGLLLFGILKCFSTKVFYRYRENYLDLNDPENDMLTAVRREDKDRYMRIVHITYFCERIAIRLGLNQEAMKCAGYYHDLEGQLPRLMRTRKIPPDARVILEEYQNRKDPIQRKETAVLIASEDVIRSILKLHSEKGADKIDYDRVIDAIFQKYRESGKFDQCNITVKELCTMQRIFKEEKLYYDFLR